MVLAAAVALAAVTLVAQLQGGGARDVEIELDVALVPDVRHARLELFRGEQVVGWAERRYDSGLPGPLRLKAPAPGPTGEVRVRLDTDSGPREVRRPLTAEGGSVVTIVIGEDE